MSINFSQGTTFHCGYSNSTSYYDQRANINFPSREVGRPVGGCRLSPALDGDSAPAESLPGSRGFYSPQDRYVPQQDPGFVPYSCKDFQRNRAGQCQPGAESVAKPTAVARPTATSTTATRKHTGAGVIPLRQSNSQSCGQTSVAMSVNYLTGRKLTDVDINSKHGFSLLSALNAESRGSGYKWSDNGNFSKKSWPAMERRLNQEKTPILIGLNGQFSASGRGHIVTLMAINGNTVTYADPADGKVKTTTKQAIENAPAHPNGKFMFVASKE